MPQTSATYGVARIRCHEKGLIGRDRMARLIDGSAEDAVRQLVDAGYGSMPDATADDAERLIDSQLKDTYTLVREVTVDPALTDLFLMKADVHNLKVLIKLRLTGSKEAPAYMAGGVWPTAQLERMVRDSDYRELPEQFRSALVGLEQGFSSRVDPVAVSVALDRAYVEYAYTFRDEFALEYFKAWADFNNVLALLRLRAMNAGQEKLKSVLLPQGYISLSRLTAAMDMPLDGLGRAIATGPARDYMLKGLDAVQKSEHISALERERDNYLIRLASNCRYATDSPAPIVGYLLGREQEAKCIRLILTAKRNRLPDGIITERLRELYG